LISGESKLLTKKILHSKFWVDEDDLAIIDETTAVKTSKIKDKVFLTDDNYDDVVITSQRGNVDLTTAEQESNEFEHEGIEFNPKMDQVHDISEN